jgi:hypothetical protein
MWRGADGAIDVARECEALSNVKLVMKNFDLDHYGRVNRLIVRLLR